MPIAIKLGRRDLEHLLMGGELRHEERNEPTVRIILADIGIQEMTEAMESAITEIRYGESQIGQSLKVGQVEDVKGD